jgi:hypothetical protein
MKPLRIAVALALASLAAPALAEKCSVCDFSDEPIVVKPKNSAGSTPSVGEVVVTKLIDAASAPLLPMRDRPPQHGANGGEVARWNLEHAWPSPAARGGSDYDGEPVTFTAQVTTEPLSAPRDRLATQAVASDQATREHVSFAYEKIVWKSWPDSSSKPKEIVVVGSKLDASPAGTAAALTGKPMNDVDRPFIAGRIPQPAAPNAVAPRAAGPASLPAQMEFRAGPAVRR